MKNTIVWDLKANTVLQIVFTYTIRKVQHKISFYYALNEDTLLDPAILGPEIQKKMLVNGFNHWLCSEVTWESILFSPTTSGFFKWTAFDILNLSEQDLDTSQGLRFSLVRYNRDKPIFFSIYGIPKELETPTRETISPMLSWFSQNFQLPYEESSLSLAFRGCTSPVQSGIDAPIIGLGAKKFKLPEKQQNTLNQNPI